MKDYFGQAKELNPSEVPTVRAVIQLGLHIKDQKQLVENMATTNLTKGDLARSMAPIVLQQWEKANPLFKPPVIIKENTLVKRIERTWQRAEDLAWGRKSKKERDNFEN